MSAIIEGNLEIAGQRRGDILDVTFDIEGVDLSGKTLLCQCRAGSGYPVVLTFKEDDSSLTKTVVSTNITTVRILKHAHEMEITPNLYHLTIIMYTGVDDVQTIIRGTLTVISQITQKP